MAASNEKLIAGGAAALGGVFLYSAVKGKSVLSTFQSLVRGQPISSGKNLPQGLTLTTGGSAVTPSGPGEVQAINAVLKTLGAPVTPANDNSMVAWANHEGVWPGGPNKGGLWNLFNTTLAEPGSSAYNSVGVQNYPTEAVGVIATVATLEVGYPNIVAALRSGRGLCGNPNLAGEFNKWSGGGYSSVC